MVGDLTQCIRTDMDCADIYNATASALSRHTGYGANITRTMLTACATAAGYPNAPAHLTVPRTVHLHRPGDALSCRCPKAVAQVGGPPTSQRRSHGAQFTEVVEFMD